MTIRLATTSEGRVRLSAVDCGEAAQRAGSTAFVDR